MFRHNRIWLRKLSFLLVVLLLTGVSILGCTRTGTEPKGWSGGAIANDALFLGSMEGKLVAVNILDGSRLWEVLLETEAPAGGFGCAPASTAVAIYGSPAVDGDLVYVGGYNGKVYAYALNRDEPKWVYPRGGNLGGPIIGGIIVAQGKLYFGSADGKVYALETTEGYKEKGWPFEAGDKIWSTPATDVDTLYIGSFDKKLYALNIADGSKKWEFETEGAIVSTPVVYNNTVFIGSFDRYLYALDAADSSLKWKFMAENWFWAKPVVCNDTIYAACLDGKVYGLDVDSGDTRVVFDLGSPISSSPVLVDDLLIVATQEGVVYALDTVNNEKWQLTDLEEKVRASLSASEGFIYIHTEADALYAVDIRSGAIREFDIKFSEER